MWVIMTYREAKLYMLCVCYTLQELEAKRSALLAGERSPVPSRLIDTADLDEVEEAIVQHGYGYFRQMRQGMAPFVRYHALIPAYMCSDRNPGKALERGIRGLCVREGREYLQNLMDGVQPGPNDGYPWRMAEDATRKELELAVALYDDELYRHLRDLAEKVDLERIGDICKSILLCRKDALLAGKAVPRVGYDNRSFSTASPELLGKALERYDEPRYAFSRKRQWDEGLRFRGGVQFYFVTDRSDTGTLVAGLVAPGAMLPLLGMACLDEQDLRKVVGFLVDRFHFNIVAEDEPEENVAFMQNMLSGLTDLAHGLDHGGVHEFFRVDLFNVRESFTHDDDMAAMVRSIDARKCSEMLFS